MKDFNDVTVVQKIQTNYHNHYYETEFVDVIFSEYSSKVDKIEMFKIIGLQLDWLFDEVKIRNIVLGAADRNKKKK